MSSPGSAISVTELPSGRFMWAELERLSRPCAGVWRGPSSGARKATALVAVAHGSRDPRSAATMSAVVADIAAARPGVDVHLAFLDLSTPSVDQIVDVVAAQGHTHAAVVPLLLGSAFHARVDLPALLDAARGRHPQLQLTQADVLGPDRRLIGALRDRVLAASGPAPEVTRCATTGLSASTGVATIGVRRSADVSSIVERGVNRSIVAALNADSAGSGRRLGVVVAAVGSSSATANARTAAVTRQLAAGTGWAVEICFATTEPSVAQAVSQLRSRGADHIIMAPWFLAPGLLTDRLVAAAPDIVHADVIGAHAALADIVWDRYDAAITSSVALSA